MLHLTDRGSIRAGRLADLMAVDGDATKDIAALRRAAGNEGQRDRAGKSGIAKLNLGWMHG